MSRFTRVLKVPKPVENYQKGPFSHSNHSFWNAKMKFSKKNSFLSIETTFFVYKMWLARAHNGQNHISMIKMAVFGQK